MNKGLNPVAACELYTPGLCLMTISVHQKAKVCHPCFMRDFQILYALLTLRAVLCC